MKVAIVGYGTAGQASALYLSAQGHDVTVFEQSPAPGPVGAGFLLQPVGLAVLASLGLHEQALAMGQRIDELHGRTVRGRPVMAMRYADHQPDSFGLGMTRGALFNVLQAAWPEASNRVRAGVRVTRVDAGTGVLTTDQDELIGPFDLVVAADGAHSLARQAMGKHVRREDMYPWGAMWCLVPAGEWPYPNQLHQRYGGTREMVGLMPVGHRPGHEGRWLTFFYSLPGADVDAFDDAALERLHQRLAVLWPEARSVTAHLCAVGDLKKARYRDVVLRRAAHGRLLVIGDAAHGMSPQLGQGANMALLDAAALGQALAETDSVADAVARFHALRASHVHTYQFMSRWLTPLFQSNRTTLGWLRDAFFYPLSRMPGTRGQALKVLTGAKQGWWR